MIKNDMLYYLAIFVICLIVTNITSSIYASFMIYTDVAFGLLVMFIGIAVGRSAFAFTNFFSIENDELTISEDNYTTRLSISAFISAFLSLYGSVQGDILYDAAMWDDVNQKYFDVPSLSYLDIFIVPFQVFTDLFGWLLIWWDYFTYYFLILSTDGIVAVTSIGFFALAVYFGYNSAWGTRYSWF